MERLTVYSLFFVFFLSIGANAYAQEGIVTFEEVVKMNIELPPEMEHMRKDMPDSHTSTKLLYFNDSASLFKNAPEDTEEEVNMHGHGGMVRMKMNPGENETYINYDDEKRIQKRDFMGRTFLITGSSANLQWRLSDERSEFLGYMCQKAVAEKDSSIYEAWFTPEISVPTGPGTGGLPGLILVMNINDGQRSYVAKELSFEEVEAGVIAAPKKGKKVSQEEFDAIVAEKMKEMNMTSSGNGGFVIRMRH